jgi:hypothetical protein
LRCKRKCPTGQEEEKDRFQRSFFSNLKVKMKK